MGNPAVVKRKKTEKRRKRYEQRLGPGVYLPKADREKVNAAVAKAEAEDKKVKAERAAARTKAKAEKAAAPAPAATAAPEQK